MSVLKLLLQVWWTLINYSYLLANGILMNSMELQKNKGTELIYFDERWSLSLSHCDTNIGATDTPLRDHVMG